MNKSEKMSMVLKLTRGNKFHDVKMETREQMPMVLQ